ncbi:hypothetical protein RvY_08618 [Ramazzottius varieornatus]|uniref:Uncharacterized protein n=1 Tax=Ramazzottius varieornatus TaxID=947166 RepID=A0A1D1V6G1_RAMVA|nr:hypothetical protein RvY_08618 [Ramazzottius varieornatus]
MEMRLSQRHPGKKTAVEGLLSIQAYIDQLLSSFLRALLKDIPKGMTDISESEDLSSLQEAGRQEISATTGKSRKVSEVTAEIDFDHTDENFQSEYNLNEVYKLVPLLILEELFGFSDLRDASRLCRYDHMTIFFSDLRNLNAIHFSPVEVTSDAMSNSKQRHGCSSATCCCKGGHTNLAS